MPSVDTVCAACGDNDHALRLVDHALHSAEQFRHELGDPARHDAVTNLAIAAATAGWRHRG